jgi:hypothetical protein
VSLVADADLGGFVIDALAGPLAEDQAGRNRAGFLASGALALHFQRRHLAAMPHTLSRPADFAPVFVMGVHRSGTTWLQQLLAETGKFDYVTAYHVIKYDALPPAHAAPEDWWETAGYRKLERTFARLGVGTRVMDDVAATPGLPEEYGFILHNAGTGYALTRKNLPLLREICRKVRTPTNDHEPPRSVVLKNPWDAANFLFIKRAIPGARFVFIHRHPERVISSALAGARALLGQRSPYLAMLSREYAKFFGPHPVYRARLRLRRFLLSRRMELGVRYITARVAAANVYYAKNIARLPADSYVSIRYEDLCERPCEVLGRVLEFLRIDPAAASALQTEARPRRGNVLPEVKWYARVVAQKNAPFMKTHWYEQGGGNSI